MRNGSGPHREREVEEVRVAAGALVAEEPSADGHGLRRWVADLYAKEVAAGRVRPSV